MPSQLAPFLPVGPLHRAQPAGRHKPVGLVTLSTALRLPPSFPPITGEFGKSHVRKKPYGDQCAIHFHTDMSKILRLFFFIGGKLQKTIQKPVSFRCALGWVRYTLIGAPRSHPYNLGVIIIIGRHATEQTLFGIFHILIQNDNCYSAIWFKVNRLLQTKENVINALLMLYNLKEHEEDKTLNTWLKDAGEREKEKWGKLSILQSMCLKMKP